MENYHEPVLFFRSIYNAVTSLAHTPLSLFDSQMSLVFVFPETKEGQSAVRLHYWTLSLSNVDVYKKHRVHRRTCRSTCLPLPYFSLRLKGEVIAVQRLSAGLLCMCAAASCQL